MDYGGGVRGVAVEPYYQQERLTLYLGDCVEVMRAMPDASVDAIVTDPPYELGFMGKHWDGTGIAYSIEMWREALRVLKPGGHLAAFGGTRTYHRMACAIEDAGFEVRDCLAWMYGSGFPKSMDVSKAIDKAAGAERAVVGTRTDGAKRIYDNGDGARMPDEFYITAPATDAARQWDGWGTALKPAYEPIVLARKPLIGTVAANVLTHGTGALNIDGCRIETDWAADRGEAWLRSGRQATADAAWQGPSEKRDGSTVADRVSPLGRWPANVLLDEEAATLLDLENEEAPSRFFYTAKASRSEREAGLEAFEESRRSDGREKDIENPRLRTNARHNDHPTVKPVDLMRWLCRLVTPPGGVILDPFNGSGTTGMGALDEGFRYIGIEREQRYIEIARHRITHRHIIETAPVEPTSELMQGRML